MAGCGGVRHVRAPVISFSVRDGIVLFHEQPVTRSQVRHSSPVPCARRGSAGLPDARRGAAHRHRPAGRGRPVRRHDRRHRRPLRRRQVDDLPPLAVARRGAARRHRVVRARSCPSPTPTPTSSTALRERRARHRSPRSTTPSGRGCVPALLMLKNHEAGIKAIDERLEHEQDMVVTTLHRAGRRGGRAGGRHRRARGDHATCSARCCSPTSPRACRSTRPSPTAPSTASWPPTAP